MTGPRPQLDDPVFVRRAAVQRYHWAAGLVAGDSVVDAGSGDGWASEPLRKLPGVAYEAFDAHPGPQMAATAVQQLALPAPAGIAVPSADTVVALELVEHVSPEQQPRVLAELWAMARRRLLLSTPNAYARRWYPQTRHFLGERNPGHLAEMCDWELANMLARLPGCAYTVTGAALDASDNLVIGGATRPAAWLFAVCDRVPDG